MHREETSNLITYIPCWILFTYVELKHAITTTYSSCISCSYVCMCLSIGSTGTRSVNEIRGKRVELLIWIISSLWSLSGLWSGYTTCSLCRLCSISLYVWSVCGLCSLCRMWSFLLGFWGLTRKRVEITEGNILIGSYIIWSYPFKDSFWIELVQKLI